MMAMKKNKTSWYVLQISRFIIQLPRVNGGVRVHRQKARMESVETDMYLWEPDDREGITSQWR